MKHSIKITKNQGKLTLEIPEGMTGKQLKQWKAKNRAALQSIEESKPVESKTEVAAVNPQIIKIYVFSGKLTLELPQGMMGYQLVQWKAQNKPILEAAKSASDGIYAILNF